MPENEVPLCIGFPGLDQRKVAGDGFLHNIFASLELPHLNYC